MKDFLTICGDPHCKPSNKDAILTLFDIFEDLGHDVVILGDMFDTKEIVRSSCFNMVFNRIKCSKLHFTILVGNHDWHNLECLEHSLEPLKVLPNVKIVDIPTKSMDGNLLMVPYYHDLNQFKKTIGAFQAKILIMHQGVTGFDYGNGHIAVDEVSLASLKKFPKVISGHFHKYQQDKNLTYLGTPFSHSFGESNQAKYLAVLNVKTSELELINSPFPGHMTYEINCDQKTKIKDYSKENFNRLILRGSEEAIAAFDTKPYEDAKIIQIPDITAASLVIDETQSNEVKFQKWAENKGLKPSVIELGMEILKGVS